MKEKITKAEFINTWASEWDETTGWKVNEYFHKQFSEELEQLIDQEVEKRIAERMPSEEEIRDELCRHLYNWLEHNSFKDACRWLRSRLTCSEKPNNSQNTEGGEG